MKLRFFSDILFPKDFVHMPFEAMKSVTWILLTIGFSEDLLNFILLLKCLAVSMLCMVRLMILFINL